MQQPTEAAENIVIVGAGIAGLATALGLHRQGIRSVVLESSPTLRAAGFAFTTWTNAWKALDALGVGDAIRAHHVRGQRLVVMSSSSGETATKLNLMIQGRSGMHEIYCVKRNFLLETLEKELPRGTIRYSSKIVSIEEDGNIKLLHLADGSIIRTKVLIGCDGVNSIVAKWLGLKKPSFSGRSETRGLAEFPNGHGFQPEFLQFSGEGFRSGLLPCSEQSLYWFFTWTPSVDEKEAEENTSKMRQYILKKLKHAKVPEEVIQVIEVSEMSDVVSSPLRLVVMSASSGETATKLNFTIQGRSTGMHEVYCVKRNLLLETLEKELPRGTIRYSSKIVSIEEDGSIKLLHLVDGSIIRTKVLIGCDGVNSIVAKWLGLKKPSFSGRSATTGFVEFPNGHGFQPELLQFFGEGFRAGLVPCSEQSLYWFFTCAAGRAIRNGVLFRKGGTLTRVPHKVT